MSDKMPNEIWVIEPWDGHIECGYVADRNKGIFTDGDKAEKYYHTSIVEQKGKRIAEMERQNTDLQKNNTDLVLKNRDLIQQTRTKIKPLQWRVKKNGTKFCTTPVGHYEIGEDGFMYYPYVCKFPTYEDALKACEKDYYDKVSLCLSISENLKA